MLLKGKFFNTFDRSETTQNFIPEIWHWSRGKGKKVKSSWTQYPQLSMSDHQPVPCSCSWTSYNHWKRLLQLSWETAGILVLKAPNILLFPHHWGQWAEACDCQYWVTVSELWKTILIGSCLTQRREMQITANPSWCIGITLCCVKSLIETVFRSYFNQLRTVGPFRTWLLLSTYYVFKMQLWTRRMMFISSWPLFTQVN